MTKHPIISGRGARGGQPNRAVLKRLYADWQERGGRPLPISLWATDIDDAVRQLIYLAGGSAALRRVIIRVNKQTKLKHGGKRRPNHDAALLAQTDGSNDEIRQLAERYWHEGAVKKKKAMIKRLQRLRDKSG